MLTAWRKDVARYLTEEAAAAGIRNLHRQYVGTAWHFLNGAGYINFGVSGEILQRAASIPADKGSVIVIGAGLAGKSYSRIHACYPPAANVPAERRWQGGITLSLAQSLFGNIR